MWYETGIDRDMVDKIIKRFEEFGKVKYVWGYLLIKNFLKHHFSGFWSPEWRSKNNQLKAISQEMLNLPIDIIQEASLFIEGFAEIYKTLGSPLQAPPKGVVPSSLSSTLSSTSKIGRFAPPSIQEVKEYCSERKNNIDPEGFVDFYQSKGRLVWKNKMKDWKASIRTREKKSWTSQLKKTTLRTSDEIQADRDLSLKKLNAERQWNN